MTAVQPRPSSAVLPLADGYGRIATDLRVSLTDRCNLRCSYCMPAEGLDWMPSERLLSDDEVGALVRIAVEKLGVNEVRFTGGEPLLRRGLESIVAAAAGASPRPEISLTTNGIGLERRLPALLAAGLDRVNVSLDTLDPSVFQTITRRKRHADVLAGLEAAARLLPGPVKVNAVLLRGVNDGEAAALLRWCLEQGYALRFIEQMPLDAQHGWDRSTMVTAAEIFELLSREFTLTPHGTPRGAAPAELFDVDGGPGTVGVIASVTSPFCAACDRTRLTADGQVRTCLFSTTETDLRGLLREGASDDVVAEAWAAAMLGKLPGHDINDPGFLQPTRPMSAIGG
ncbi:GTP 3',8-cyclase MoaA [Jatrophihabitans sp. YIM 134969]